MLCKKNNYKAFIGGAVLGLIFFVILYGIEPVIFTNDSFVLNGYIEKDISQHYSGWMLYRNSPWQFPLGLGQNIAYPYGNVVSFTDSIPLFAIFFKALNSLLPATFQYFGLFVLICFMLQGGFGAIIANLFNDNLFVDILASAVFLLTPVMLERAFRHCALTAHFFILAALYYYFRNKGRTDFKAYIPFIVINAFSVTVHPYFMPFTFGIMFAFCIENFFAEREHFYSLLYLALSICLTVFIGWVIGIFYVNGSVTSIGYGFFSMNLNALYNPVSKGFENWSSVLGQKPNMYLQIEGFNYLGLGIILFLPLSFALFILKYRKKSVRKAVCFLKKYFGIVFSTSALLLFAVGDWVRFGGMELFRIPFPDFLVNGLFGIFRANGRFGNMLVYMLIIFVIYTLSSLSEKKISVVLFSLLLALQIFDLRLVLNSKYNYFHGINENLQAQNAPQVLYNSFWDDAAERYDILYMLSDCVPNANFELTSKFAKNSKAVNTRFDIKIDEEKFMAMEKDVLESIANDTLPENCIVLLNFIPDKYKDSINSGSLAVYCIEDIVVVCNDIYTPQQLEQFESEGNFRILEYPYTVQAELDFKAEYGL